jgi:hypothetical protein
MDLRPHPAPGQVSGLNVDAEMPTAGGGTLTGRWYTWRPTGKSVRPPTVWSLGAVLRRLMVRPADSRCLGEMLPSALPYEVICFGGCVLAST